MRQLTKTAAAAAFGAALFTAGAAHAIPIKTALSLVIDASGSISGAEFETQRNAYSSLLGNASVLPADGSVVINFVQFASTARLEQTAIRIVDEAARTTLLDSIAAMTTLGGGTNIGAGINTGRIDMDAYLAGIAASEFDVAFTKLIDVSTDGVGSVGTAVTDAANAGYSQINCLGIGAGANCTWNDGFGVDFAANAFDDLAAVLEVKLRTEIGTVPVPGTIALLGLGLVGFGLARRRAA
jgi:hypothetical protein